MTSYGRGNAEIAGRPLTVEIRSVNHRYLDLRIKMARRFLPLEERIKKVVAATFNRGHVDVIVEAPEGGAGSIKLRADLDLARQYHECLGTVATELGLDDRPALDQLINFRDIIVAEEVEEDSEATWSVLEQALNNALTDAVRMREAEGASLRNDLLERLELLKKTLSEIEAKIPEVLAERQAALNERINKLLEDSRLDPARMNQEAVILADRCDVTEEIVRLKSHFSQFGEIIEQDEPVGRRLDFLLQEFFREINTMASKISNAEIAHHTVTLKNEVEKMREQVQNIE